MNPNQPQHDAIEALLAGETPDLSEIVASPEDYAAFLLALEDRDLAAQEAGDEAVADAAHNLVMAFLLSVYEKRKDDEHMAARLKAMRLFLAVNKDLEDETLSRHVDNEEEVRGILFALGCATQIFVQVTEEIESGKESRKNEILSNNASNYIDIGMQALREALEDLAGE